MKRFVMPVLMIAVAGCCSYSELKTDCGTVKVDGEPILATYEVVNPSYKLLSVIPITCGKTWKSGPYEQDVGSVRLFGGECSLDDNLASVRHACRTVGGDRIAHVIGRDDVYYAWSLFFVKKEVVKTSCVILGPRPLGRK